jgi:replication-associated recombination protein RarA
MLDGGADPLYMGRRIVRMAIEDVGLADPRAWEIALNACATYERLGSPEGELALANAVLYLAVAPNRTPPTSPIMPPALSWPRTRAAACRSTCATRRPS